MSYVRYTDQIRDFIDWCIKNDYAMVLYVRNAHVEIDPRLQRWIDMGRVVRVNVW